MPHKFLPWLAIASAMSAFTLQAQAMPDTELLIGSYTQGKSEGIYRFAFDSETGMIGAKPLQVVKAENPSWLTVSRDQRYLFAVNENGPGQKTWSVRSAALRSTRKPVRSRRSIRFKAAAKNRRTPA